MQRPALTLLWGDGTLWKDTLMKTAVQRGWRAAICQSLYLWSRALSIYVKQRITSAKCSYKRSFTFLTLWILHEALSDLIFVVPVVTLYYRVTSFITGDFILSIHSNFIYMQEIICNRVNSKTKKGRGKKTKHADAEKLSLKKIC